MHRTVRWMAIVVGIVVLCAGCRLDVRAEVIMADDGSGTVTVTLTADAELLAKAPGAVADLRLDDVRAAGWSVTGPVGSADGGTVVTVAKPFRTPAEGDAVLAELNGPAGPLHDMHLVLTRSFATRTVAMSGHVRVDGGPGALGDEGLVAQLGGKQPFADRLDRPFAEAVHLTVLVELPGTVTSSVGGTAAADRHSITFEPSLAAGVDTELRGTWVTKDQGALDARATQRTARYAIVAYVLVLVTLAVFGFAWWRRR